jgi:protein involved in polysaccharide export with SLBB domain
MIRILPLLAFIAWSCSCAPQRPSTSSFAPSRPTSTKPAADEGPVVTVGGEVQRPGEVPYRIGGTVLTAIYTAGGPGDYAAMNRVKLIRNGTVRVVNLNRDEAKTGATLMPGDVIEVPSRNVLGF